MPAYRLTGGRRWSRIAWPGAVSSILLVLAMAGVAGAALAPPGFGTASLARGDVHYQLEYRPRCPPPRCPLVVLVPGFAVPMIVWDRTVPALLEAGLSVLRFDLYGRGRSARPPGPYTPELFEQQLWELIETLGLPPRFHVVASSMGGVIAAVFANRHPDAFDKVILVGPAGLSRDFPLVTTLLKMPGLGRWFFQSRFREEMLGHLQENVHADICAYPAVTAEFRRQLDVPGSASAMFSTLRETLLRDHTAEFHGLGRLRRPTLLLWGRKDALLSPCGARDVRHAIPHLVLKTIRGSGHLPQLERPAAFNSLVIRFLRDTQVDHPEEDACSTTTSLRR